MFDLDSYLRRIGLEGGDLELADIHRAHVTSIPFESLDPHRGVAVSLDEDDLARKLVGELRGGYCFEQNLLLKAGVEAMGARVELYLARVLLGSDPAVPRARSHLLLGVDWKGQHWHADAGFGSGTLLEPLPWGPGDVVRDAGWSHRVSERDGEYVLQTKMGPEWADLYAFLPRPVPRAEVEPANWWTSTNPNSVFVNGFLVSRQWEDGRRLLMSDWGELALIETTPGSGPQREPLKRARIPALLADRFGLPGFALDEDGRIVRAP